MPELAFQKVTSSPYLFFLAIAQQENKDIALNFLKRVVCLYVDNTHSVFMDILENLNNVCNYL